jgi:hypothetical protein
MMSLLRRSLVFKLCAGLFVVLIVLPFTAPFRAWDSGAPFGKPSSQDLKTSDDLSNDAALAACTASLVPVAISDIVHGRTLKGRTTPPPVLQLVLRL